MENAREKEELGEDEETSRNPQRSDRGFGEYYLFTGGGKRRSGRRNEEERSSCDVSPNRIPGNSDPASGVNAGGVLENAW